MPYDNPREGDFDLDGNGTFETVGTTEEGNFDFIGITTAEKTYSSPATIRVSHLLEARSALTAMLRDRSVVTGELVIQAPEQANQPPLASFAAAPNPAEPGQLIILDASSASSDPDGTIAKYEWDLDGDGGYERDTGSSFSTSTSFAAEGSHKVGLRVTDDDGATATTTLTIVVRAIPNQPPVASFTASPNPAEPEQPITLDASASSDPDGQITRYEWDLDGDGSFEVLTGTTPTTTTFYEAVEEHVVGLRVTDDEGASATTTLTIVVGFAATAARASAAHGEISERRRVRFVLRGDGREVRPGRYLLNGSELLTLGTKLRGKISARRFPKKLRHKGRRVRWAARFDTETDLTTGRSLVHGIALLHFPAGGLACLAYRLDVPDDRRGTGSFRVLGGKGKAKRLRARGNGTARVRRNSIKLVGRGKLRLRRNNKAWRNLGRHGCGSLRLP